MPLVPYTYRPPVVVPYGPTPCGAELVRTSCGDYVIRDVGGERCAALFRGRLGGWEYPPCPHADCRGLVCVPEDIEAVPQKCGCGAIHVVPVRVVRAGVIRIELRKAD